MAAFLLFVRVVFAPLPRSSASGLLRTRAERWDRGEWRELLAETRAHAAAQAARRQRAREDTAAAREQVAADDAELPSWSRLHAHPQ